MKMVKFSTVIYMLTINLTRSFSATTTGVERSTAGECDGVCVPYYVCDSNRTVIKDGSTLMDIRKKRSTNPCSSSIDICCKLNAVNDAIITPRTKPTTSSCGTRNIYGVSSLRIIGDQDKAQFGEFPWMVAITQRTGESDVYYICGGSLISSQVVLTAAHCVKGKTNLSVTAGKWDSHFAMEPLATQTRLVREVLVHEEFNAQNLHNDVALLVLETPVVPAGNVGTICLPEQDEVMDERHCLATGWGKDQNGIKGTYQTYLKKVELPIVARGQCLKALRETRLYKYFELDKSFICAGGVPGKDTCQGDGGGPLACPSSGDSQVYVQAGIVAWGIGCNTQTPGVYVNVAHFRNWIDNKLRAFNI